MGLYILLTALMAFAVPLFCGIMLLFQSKRGGRGHPTCGGCGYDVSATLGAGKVTCPECGGEFANIGVMPAASRADRRMMLLGVALIASPVLSCGNIAVLLPVYNAYLRAPQRPIIVQQASTTAPVTPLSQSTSQPQPTDRLPTPDTLGETLPDR